MRFSDVETRESSVVFNPQWKFNTCACIIVLNLKETTMFFLYAAPCCQCCVWLEAEAAAAAAAAAVADCVVMEGAGL